MSMRTVLLAAAFLEMACLAPASADVIEGYPDTIVCRIGSDRIVGYLHKVSDDGSAVYMTLARSFATVTPDGVVHRDGAEDCDGRTLEELRSNS